MMLIAAHLFRLESPLRLTRTSSVSRRAAPAVLVIPREGPLHAPHLMVVAGTCAGLPSGELVVRDTHLVVQSDDLTGRDLRELADVLVSRRPSDAPADVVVGGRPSDTAPDVLVNRRPLDVPPDVLVNRRPSDTSADRVADILDRYLGCTVAVDRCSRDCLVGLQDGPLAEIVGAAGFVAAADPWPAVFGSFLYCWLVGAIPFEGLPTASVIAGHYTDSAARAGRFEVAGRVRVRLLDRRPWRVR
jgi:hypothetical protein